MFDETNPPPPGISPSVAGVAAGVSPAEHPPPTDLQIINGGIEIDAVKIDGSSERVKVRQLPIALLHLYGTNQGAQDEAYLIELLCDHVDRTTVHHLTNGYMAEMRVREILQHAPFEQMDAIKQRLHSIRTEIAALEAKPRWSDTLTHESVAEIRELGERLNKKKYVDQMTRTAAAAKTILETMAPPSASPMSSAPSPTSAESTSAT